MVTPGAGPRPKAGRWLGPALLLALSGCGALLDIESADSSGECKANKDCPAGEFCFEGTCQSSCESDHDCPAGLSCTETDGGAACMMVIVPDAGRLTSDAGVAVDDGSTATGSPDTGAPATDALDEPMCPPCDPLSTACIDGTCRPLAWASPESDYVEPLPQPIAKRIYYPVPPDELYAQRIQLAQPGFLVALGVLASTGQKPISFGLALYHDNGGFPLDPFVTPPAQTLSTDTQNTGRQEVAVSPPVHLDANTYWIAFVSQAGGLALQSAGAGSIGTAEWTVPDAGDPWLDPFPATSAPPMTTQDNAIAIYAVVALDPP